MLPFTFCTNNYPLGVVAMRHSLLSFYFPFIYFLVDGIPCLAQRCRSIYETVRWSAHIVSWPLDRFYYLVLLSKYLFFQETRNCCYMAVRFVLELAVTRQLSLCNYIKTAAMWHPSVFSILVDYFLEYQYLLLHDSLIFSFSWACCSTAAPFSNNVGIAHGTPLIFHLEFAVSRQLKLYK